MSFTQRCKDLVDQHGFEIGQLCRAVMDEHNTESQELAVFVVVGKVPAILFQQALACQWQDDALLAVLTRAEGADALDILDHPSDAVRERRPRGLVWAHMIINGHCGQLELS